MQNGDKLTQLEDCGSSDSTFQFGNNMCGFYNDKQVDTIPPGLS